MGNALWDGRRFRIHHSVLFGPFSQDQRNEFRTLVQSQQARGNNKEELIVQLFGSEGVTTTRLPELTIRFKDPAIASASGNEKPF